MVKEGLKLSNKWSRKDAKNAIDIVIKYLKMAGLKDDEILVGGSYRRGKSLIGDIDFALISNK